MAVEWKRVAMANDLKERTLSFKHEGVSAKGITDLGISFLRSSTDSTLHHPVIDGNFPTINWSAVVQTGADLGSIEFWTSGADGTGIDTSTAHFYLRPDLSNGTTANRDHVLESTWSSVMIVPGGDSNVKKHKIKISGLIRNDAATTEPNSNDTRLHFSIWRAYAGNYSYMTESQSGLLFRKVGHGIRYGNLSSPYGAQYAPVEPGSILTFSLDETEINLDPDECGEGKSCYYLVGLWASTATSSYYYATNAVNWPQTDQSAQASIKIQTDITYTPE